jgi:hypothetical protein
MAPYSSRIREAHPDRLPLSTA